MAFRLMACMTLALTVFVTSAVAQDEGGGRQRGQRGQQGGPGGGGAFGFGMRNQGPSGASSIFRMLAIVEVRKEVGVTDEVYETVSKQMAEINEKLRNRDLSEEDRKKLGEEANTKAQEIMDEILTPAKLKRLKGLYAQQSPSRAVLNLVIAKDIGLPEEKRTEIEKALAEQREKNRANFQPGGGGGQGVNFQELMAKAEEENMKLVDSKLSADQKKAFEELKGEKFKFPEFNFGGQGGGRGGQGGGQGGRPRGDGN